MRTVRHMSYPLRSLKTVVVEVRHTGLGCQSILTRSLVRSLSLAGFLALAPAGCFGTTFSFVTIDAPGQNDPISFTDVSGINNAGDIVGRANTQKPAHAFVDAAGL